MKDTEIIFAKIVDSCDLSERHPKEFPSIRELNRHIYNIYSSFGDQLRGVGRPLEDQLHIQ